MLSLKLPFYSYGILMGLAFIISLLMFRKNLALAGIKNLSFIDYFLVVSIPGIIGARILYIFLYPQQFHSLRDILALHEGGLVFYGGFVFAALSLMLYARLNKIPLRVLTDLLAPCVALGHSIGRIGCLLNGCCYGSITNFKTGFRLSSDPATIFRHPVQLYEAVFLFSCFNLLNWLIFQTYKRERFLYGLSCGIYLMCYSTFRFLIEFIRGDDRGGFYFYQLFSISQILSLGLLLFSMLWIIYILRDDKKFRKIWSNDKNN